MELQKAQEGRVAGGGHGNATFALAQVLEEVRDNVVQGPTAASADGVV